MVTGGKPIPPEITQRILESQAKHDTAKERNDRLRHEFEHPTPDDRWQELVPDLSLRNALQYTYDTLPWWRWYWDFAPVPIAWAEQTSRGRFTNGAITIGSHFRWDWKDVIGSTIVHESIHAVAAKRSTCKRTRELAYLEELDACLTESVAWKQLALNPENRHGSCGILWNLVDWLADGSLLPRLRESVDAWERD